jgi:hypothetical protein
MPITLAPLTKAVELADHLAFREIARKYLQLRGYREPRITDGPRDAGADLLVRTLGGNQTPLAVAITTQAKDVPTKLRKDCRRAKEALGLDVVHFLSSRRLANADFMGVVDDLWKQDGIRVRTIDSQEIAAAFRDSGDGQLLLDAIGIRQDEQRPEAVERPDLREDAAYAFALFGDVSENFRRSVIEQTLLSYVVDKSSQTRGEVESGVVDALQLSQDQAPLVVGAVDRTLQRGLVHLADDNLVPDDSVTKAFCVMRPIRERQWKELLKDIEGALGRRGLVGSRLVSATDAVMSNAGALVMAAATAAGASIGLNRDPAPVRQQLRKRVKELAADLSASGMTEEAVTETMSELARLVSNSAIGHMLMAGELFIALTSMQTNEFERAFGATASEIYLDASVAIPMIAALLYEPADTRFSAAALRMYEIASARGIPLLLPRVYLEEAAAHLVEARDWYPPLVGDSDLRFSGNAYVAHYADLASRGKVDGGLERYTDNLGYVGGSRSAQRQIAAVAAKLEGSFQLYNIRVVEFEPASKQNLRQAEEAMTYTANDLGLTRHGRLLRHDAGVVARFMEAEARADIVRIFCTWDRLHLFLRTDEGRARWQPLDPVMLGDVLVLSQRESREELMTTTHVAVELTEAEGERGALVLDRLVGIERSKVHDADLLRMMREFKEAYLQAQRDGGQVEELAEAWSAWKGGERDLIRQTSLALEG